jgi:hypothetical protein
MLLFLGRLQAAGETIARLELVKRFCFVCGGERGSVVCQHHEAYFHWTRRFYHCKACGYQVSLIGMLFLPPPLPPYPPGQSGARFPGEWRFTLA